MPDGKDVEDALVRLRTRIEELGVEVEADFSEAGFFHTDFHYLINVIESANSGEELFAL